jgi:hypothetical protein
MILIYYIYKCVKLKKLLKDAILHNTLTPFPKNANSVYVNLTIVQFVMRQCAS